MKVLLAPAIAVMNRLTTAQRMLLIATLFTLMLAYVLYVLISARSAVWNDPAVLLIAGGWMLASYQQFVQHLFVKQGFSGLRQAVERLSAGDLEYGSDTVGGGDIGAMLSLLKGIRTGLSAVFAQAQASAKVIDGAAKEVAAGHVNLSQRTEEQASSLEETASGMEELAATVKQNAENCQLASGLSKSARWRTRGRRR